MKETKLVIGDRLRVTSPIDIYPHCIIDVGAILVVVGVDTALHQTEDGKGWSPRVEQLCPL